MKVHYRNESISALSQSSDERLFNIMEFESGESIFMTIDDMKNIILLWETEYARRNHELAVANQQVGCCTCGHSVQAHVLAMTGRRDACDHCNCVSYKEVPLGDSNAASP